MADRWPRALSSIASLVDGFGAAMFSFQPVDGRWVATPSMAPVVAEFTALGRPEMNIRSPRAIALRHPGFITDFEGCTEEEIENHPFYKEFLRPRGLGWCAGTVIFVPGGDTLVTSIERSFDRGPVSRAEVAVLDQIRPHLARAAAFSARLALERVRAAAEALGVLGLPAAVLGTRHQLIVCNAMFHALVPDIFLDGRERLTLVDSAADRLLADALARDAVRAGGGVLSIPLPANESRPAMVVHVLPIRGSARDIFTSASAIILATPVVPSNAPAQQLLEGLFDLTPGESRVARAISQGETVQKISTSLGISQETVRAQLKAVFSKTGTHRQAELVRLLAGTVSIGTEVFR